MVIKTRISQLVQLRMVRNQKLFYAVKIGAKPGVYESWDECSKYVKGYPNAVYKKFKTLSEARNFMDIRVNDKDKACDIYRKFNLTSGEKRTTSISETSNIDKTKSDKDTYINKNIELNSSEEQKNEESEHEIYIDGAARNNGSKKALAGYGVFFGDGDERNVGLPVKGPFQTNQRAELLAAQHAITSIYKELKLNNMVPVIRYKLKTDSHYVLNCLTKWYKSWEQNNWQITRYNQHNHLKTKNTRFHHHINAKSSSSSTLGVETINSKKEVMHKDIIKPTVEMLKIINGVYKQRNWGDLKIEYVKAHCGIFGNEMADNLANQGVDRQSYL